LQTTNEPANKQPLSKRILFIYDEWIIADMYQQRLERINYQVFISKIDNNILEKTNSANPQLIIISQATPNNKSFNTIALLRHSVEYERTPIIMLYGNTSNDINEKSFLAGCNEVFDSSIKFDALTKNLNYYFTVYPLLVNKKLANNTTAIYELVTILQAKLPNNLSFTPAIKENLINSLDEIIQGTKNALTHQEKEKLMPLVSGLSGPAYTIALKLLT